MMLAVPHHIGDTSLTEPFLEAVSPEVAIISVGADNRFDHPGAVTLENLEEIAASRTGLDGSIKLETDGVKCCLRAGRWTWRQSDRAKSAPQTCNALLTAEGVNNIERTEVEAAMEELVSLVREHCGGEVSWSMLDHDHPWAVME